MRFSIFQNALLILSVLFGLAINTVLFFDLKQSNARASLSKSNEKIQYLSADEMVIIYFINKYVQARESYHPFAYEMNYNHVVRVLSTEKAYKEFAAHFAEDNPENILRLGASKMRSVKIRSIAFMRPSYKTIQVYFKVIDSDIGSGKKETAEENDYVVNLQYSFSNLHNISAQGRMMNPLGLQVRNYYKAAK